MRLFFGEKSKYIYFVGIRVSRDAEASGGAIISTEDELYEEEIYKIGTYLEHIYNFIINKEYSQRLKSQSILSAGATILIESYAHNIGAHGLEGLRLHLYDQWKKYRKNYEPILSARNKLLDKGLDASELIKTHSQFMEYIVYLQGKSAFWNAISRGGNLIGGEISNAWDLIDGFARNNLFCGSLGSSEKYSGINFFIKYNGQITNIGESRIEDDFRYRFEEEDFNDPIKGYQKRINVNSIKAQNIASDTQKIKRKLQELEIFLPEGIVGRQAIYTIWENIIRNIKHCNNDGEKSIPFFIEIDESCFKVEIKNWIDVSSKNDKEIELEDKVIKMKQWPGILKDDKPNMGGISQNILCAGMAVGMNFVDAERKQKSDEKLMRFELKTENDKKILIYNFDLWKGYDWIKWTELREKNKKDEPTGRFKMIILKDDTERDNFLKESSNIRHCVANGENTFEGFYATWIKKFVINEKYYPHGLGICHCEYNKEEYILAKNGNIEKDRVCEANTNASLYNLMHDPVNEKQGWINIKYKKDGKIVKLDINNEKMRFELFEIIGIKMDIFDQRLHNIANYSFSDQQTNLKNLNTYISRLSPL